MCTHVYKSGKVQTKNFCAGRFEFLEAKGRENCMNVVMSVSLMLRIFFKFCQNTLGLFKDMRVFSLLHKDMISGVSLHFFRDPYIEAIVGFSIQNITNEVT